MLGNPLSASEIWEMTEEVTTTQTDWWKDPVKQYYLYAQDNEIGSLDATNTITELRILGEGYGAEIAASIALELAGTTYIPIHDRQGNIALLLDLQGNPQETYHYDAFGNETIYSKLPTNNPWRFSSKRVDPETGLVYFGRRYYDPSIGKWLTQDPLGLKEGPNLYAYCVNNPMTRIDLYGLFVEDSRTGDWSFDGRVDTHDSNDKGFAAAFNETVRDLGNYIKDWVCDTVKEEMHGDLVNDWVFDRCEKLEVVIAPDDFSVQELSCSNYLKDWFLQRLIDYGSSKGKSKGKFPGNNKKLQTSAAKGREQHRIFAEKVKQKPGWQSEKNYCRAFRRKVAT